MVSDLPELMTPKQFAEAVGKNDAAIRRQCQAGVIPAKKIGSYWVIPRDLVFREFVEEERKCQEESARQMA